MKEKALRLSSEEREVLRAIDERKTINDISTEIDLPEIGVLRAGSYLAAEGLADEDVEHTTTYVLTEKGKQYTDENLPEIQIFNALPDDGKSINELLTAFSKNEVNASIGRLKEHDLITLDRRDGDLYLVPAKKDVDEYPAQQTLLSTPISQDNHDDAVNSLLKRDLLDEDEEKTTWFERTEEGDNILSTLSEINLVETLTSQDIEQETWKNKEFRHYRITSQVKPSRTGRKHFVREAIDEIKDFWVSLGFEEMKGNHVQSAFWDLDALFVPQDHPARDLQDTFYIDRESDLSDEYVERVKAIHENGGSLNSDGWSQSFEEHTARKTLLRTHTTVLSAKKFASLSKDDLPKKYFSVDKAYRNETLDWSHLMEFHQVEGIVVTEEGSLARLISYLKEFFGEMGYDDIRLRPAFFPYTEPSAEVDAYNEDKEEWVEIGGAGVIRPEVTEPLLGFRCPVLAWGTGLERILTAYYDINDLRELYENNINDLQKMKVFHAHDNS